MTTVGRGRQRVGPSRGGHGIRAPRTFTGECHRAFQANDRLILNLDRLRQDPPLRSGRVGHDYANVNE